jgi:hypothetical protein
MNTIYRLDRVTEAEVQQQGRAELEMEMGLQRFIQGLSTIQFTRTTPWP